MRFSILSTFAVFVGLSAACQYGEYTCGTGEQANTVMQCEANGNLRPINTCGKGVSCQVVSGRAVCA